MIHCPSSSLVSDTLNHSFQFRWLEAPNHLRRSVLQLRQPPPSLSFSFASAGVRRIASLLACLLLNIVWCSVLKILPSKSLTRIRVEKRYSLSLLKTHEDAITNIKNELAVVELKVQVGGCQYIMFPGTYIYTKRLKDAKRLKSSLRWVWPWEE